MLDGLYIATTWQRLIVAMITLQGCASSYALARRSVLPYRRGNDLTRAGVMESPRSACILTRKKPST